MKVFLEDLIMKEFVDFIDFINVLVEESLGFIWCLKDKEGGFLMNIEVFLENDMIIVNMFVWEDLESFKFYVY